VRRSLAVLAALAGAACGLGIHEPTGPCGEDAHVGPTPQQLAFVSDARFGQFDICLINVDGTAVAQLTTSLATDWWPSWSPDGSKIAFMTGRTVIPAHDTVAARTAWDLYVINADGTGETPLTSDTTNEGQPTWSPDGTKLAFITDRDGNNEIYVINADGTGLRRLTADPADDEQPAWSPDGAKIAFVSNRSGRLNIWVMDSTGANLVNVTNGATTDFGPAWSPPNGAKIAFHSDRGGGFDIYVMNADGTNVARLTNGSTPAELPSWSPDGSRIAFDRDGKVWVMRADGSGAAQVTHGKFVNNFMARWRP